MSEPSTGWEQDLAVPVTVGANTFDSVDSLCCRIEMLEQAVMNLWAVQIKRLPADAPAAVGARRFAERVNEERAHAWLDHVGVAARALDRSAESMERVFAALRRAHAKWPDMRVAQLLCAAAGGDPFAVENGDVERAGTAMVEDART